MFLCEGRRQGRMLEVTMVAIRMPVMVIVSDRDRMREVSNGCV